MVALGETLVTPAADQQAAHVQVKAASVLLVVASGGRRDEALGSPAERPLVGEWGQDTCRLAQAEAEMMEGHNQGLVGDTQGRASGLVVQQGEEGKTVVLHWVVRAGVAPYCLVAWM